MITKIELWQDDDAVWHYEYTTSLGSTDSGRVDEFLDPPNGIACDEWLDDAMYAVCMAFDERRESFGVMQCHANRATIERL